VTLYPEQLRREEVGRLVLEKGLGTVRVGARSVVFMPRSFYVLALLSMLAVGLALGRFVL
jgi:hypothetical protein